MEQFRLNNLVLARSYDNYKVLDRGGENNKCLVCFSSNGLYYPNSEESLNKVLNDDKYEWENFLPPDFSRVVLVRDVYKQWYVRGISESCDSIEKLKLLLISLTDSFDTTFVGSSAGGYAAVLFGNLCQANKIINFSGQFNITHELIKLDKNKILCSIKDNDYLDLSDMKSKVYYFCPEGSEIDVFQKNFVKDIDNVITINVLSNKHGVPLYPFAIRRLLSSSSVRLDSLSSKSYSRTLLSMRFVNWSDFKTYFILKLKRKLKVSSLPFELL